MEHKNNNIIENREVESLDFKVVGTAEDAYFYKLDEDGNEEVVSYIGEFPIVEMPSGVTTVFHF